MKVPAILNLKAKSLLQVLQKRSNSMKARWKEDQRMADQRMAAPSWSSLKSADRKTLGLMLKYSKMTMVQSSKAPAQRGSMAKPPKTWSSRNHSRMANPKMVDPKRASRKMAGPKTVCLMEGMWKKA